MQRLPQRAEEIPAAARARRGFCPCAILKNLALRLAGRTGAWLNWLLGGRAIAPVGILTYHRIAPRVPGLPPPLHNVTPGRFGDQLAGLLARGFRVWPLEEVLRARQHGEPIAPRTVVITFDDGYQTVYTRAWPILKQRRLPATLFLVTAYLDCPSPFWFDGWGTAYKDLAPAETYRPLTTEQCREMAEQGLMEIGCHTHQHLDFRDQIAAFRQDIETSLGTLESRLGRRAAAFAFPYGRCREGFASDQLIDVVRQSGLACGLTTENETVDLASDPFCWGRFNVFDWDTAATLAAKLEGWYAWAPKLYRCLESALCGEHGHRTVRGPETSLRTLGQGAAGRAHEKHGRSS